MGADAPGDASDTCPTAAGLGSCPTGCAACDLISALSAGVRHTCALSSRGELWCWGERWGLGLDLGPGVFDSHAITRAQRVPAIPAAVDVAAGWEFTVALTETDGALVWGRSRLGAGVPPNRLGSTPPTLLAGSAGATHLAVGGKTIITWSAARATLAGVDLDGVPWTDPADLDLVAEPLAIDALAGADAVAIGRWFACARDGAAVRCWGANPDGQLGTGDRAPRAAPTAVHGALTAAPALLAAGPRHACVAAADSPRVQCWGANEAGQLGVDPAIAPDAPIPVDVSAGLERPVVALALGDRHSCALQDDGAVLCWGDNDHGQLASAAVSRSWRPVLAQGLPETKLIAAGADFVCAVGASGGVRCWGDNRYGQLGTGAAGATMNPTPLVVYATP